MPERSRHCDSEEPCREDVYFPHATERKFLGKAQASDELEPGELPD